MNCLTKMMQCFFCYSQCLPKKVKKKIKKKKKRKEKKMKGEIQKRTCFIFIVLRNLLRPYFPQYGYK